MQQSKYDYIIVGAGFFGATFAHEMTRAGKTCLVIERRPHIGGNAYTECKHGIHVHKYGPHIFHTANKDIWDYVNQFAEFNNFQYRPRVNYNGDIYSFPINLMTLNQLWGVRTPNEAKRKLEEVRVPLKKERADNLEEWILSQVGHEIYEIFIKGYTTKQWNRDPKELPPSIIKRIPIRLTYNDRYYPEKDRWEGIPIGGYTQIFQNMLKNSDLCLGVDFFTGKSNWVRRAKKIVYTGMIDRYFEYEFGDLEYRSLKFETEVLDTPDFQGVAGINYTSENVPYTRIVEHKHFEFVENNTRTIVTKEYPEDYERGKNAALYPIGDKRNKDIYAKYAKLAQNEENVIFGGRLGSYQYYNMDQVIASARKAAHKEIEGSDS